MGGGGPKVPGQYIGGWGDLGAQKFKGVVTYSISGNRQNPLANNLHLAIFNTWRRFSGQALYVIPPMILGYAALNWAVERNHFLNSKEGRAIHGDNA